ncbi:MAG: hypothetical protein LIO93_07705, partial [Bacteroidales bacterium]|nr:hypothetical protein [Bacteroidales bacterium]
NKYKHYYYQVQEQLLCTGLQECNLVFLSVTSYNDEENLTRVIQPNVLSLPPFYFVFMKYYLPLKTPLNSTTMYAEKTQKESPSRTIQTKPGGGRVYMEDNRPEAVRQTEFINTIQLKEKNQLYPIIQRTKITTSISQSSSESSLDGVRDLEKKEDVNELLSDLVIEVRYSADVIGKALRSKIAISLDHPDATWDELFKGYLTAEDRKVMTKVWKKWFYEPVPWDVGDEEKGKEKEEEKKEEEKKPSPYKGEKISPFTRRHQKGEFVGNPEAIHIHIVVTRLI